MTSFLYECDFNGCKESFRKHSRLLEHKCGHTGERPQKCTYPDCEKSYVRSDHLKRHIATVHERTVDHVCSHPGCGRVYSSSANLKRHVKTHQDAFPYKCSEDGCQAEFKKRQRLLTHMGESHNKKQFHCTHDGCELAFRLPSALKRHLKLHDKEYRCSHEGCDFMGKSWSILQQHISDSHSVDYVCSVCGLSLSTSKKLEDHSETHKEKRLLFTCPWEGCKRSYTTKFNLDQHTKSFHHGLKPYSCSSCPSSFAHKHSLMRHITNMHINVSLRKVPGRRKLRKRQRKLAEVISGRVGPTASGGDAEQDPSEVSVPLGASLLR